MLNRIFRLFCYVLFSYCFITRSSWIKMMYLTALFRGFYWQWSYFSSANEVTHWLWENLTRGPLHKRHFNRNSNLMEISFSSYLSYSTVIAMKCYTWHNSCAVVAYAKFCGIMVPYHVVTLILNFHRIWITMEKSFVQWAPVPNSSKIQKALIMGILAIYWM